MVFSRNDNPTRESWGRCVSINGIKSEVANQSGAVRVRTIKALRASTAELSIDQIKAPTNLAVMI